MKLKRKTMLMIIWITTLSLLIIPAKAEADHNKFDGDVVEIYGDSNAGSYLKNRIIVVLTNEASLKFKNYLAEDFAEVDCINVCSLTSYSDKIIKEKYESYKNSLMLKSNDCECDTNNALDSSITKYKQILCLTLSDDQDVMTAIKILESKDWVFCATPDYTTSVCSITPNDTYYGANTVDIFAPGKTYIVVIKTVVDI